jgi:putative SOS response-associated peptidase YedK
VSGRYSERSRERDLTRVRSGNIQPTSVRDLLDFLTTIPNSVTSPVHDGMPVILGRDEYDLWLDPGMSDVGAATDLMKPVEVNPKQFRRRNSALYRRSLC